jgi:hypothetical protein
MTDKERKIVDELLDAITRVSDEHRGYAINCYSEFLHTIGTRMSIEAQRIENEKNRKPDRQ